MRKNILIVDDSLFMRNILKRTIQNTGLDLNIVGEASNGIEALEQFHKLKPDIVTLDVTMDKKDGLDTLKDIRKINTEAKVIMVSAMGQEFIVLDAVKSGANDFIVKPFTDKKIYDTFSKFL